MTATPIRTLALEEFTRRQTRAGAVVDIFALQHELGYSRLLSMAHDCN